MSESADRRVSVIIPTYNRADLLPRAVQSVLAQTYKNIELIVMDGSPGMGAERVLEPFLSDSRVRYIHQKDDGRSMARNVGIRLATGAYIAPLDDDDEWLPEKIEKQIAEFDRDPSLGAVFCWLTIIDEHLHKEKLMKIEIEGTLRAGDAARVYLERAARGAWFSNPSAIVFKKSTGMLFDEGMREIEDVDFTMSLLEKNNVSCVPESLVRYHLHGTNASRPADTKRKVAMAEYWARILKKHESTFLQETAAYCAFLRGVGTYFLEAGQRGKSVRYFLKAVKLRPDLPKNYLFLVVPIFGATAFQFVLNIKTKLSWI
jgi:glycosyltransferase involved in cell wall biosynthesis